MVSDTTLIPGSTISITAVRNSVSENANMFSADLTAGSYVCIEFNCPANTTLLAAKLLIERDVGVGFQGYQGRQGGQGWQGSQGFQGLAGAQGFQGFQGWQGAGAQGFQGWQGVAGVQGAQGWQGVQGAQGSQGNQGWQGSIGYQQKVATDLLTSNPATDTLIAGTGQSMTMTPASGTYAAWFSSSLSGSANSAYGFVSIWSGGAQITNSERRIDTAVAGEYLAAQTQAVATVNGAEAIEARWRMGSGSGTLFSRNLIILKVG
jgi:hypothetical protein